MSYCSFLPFPICWESIPYGCLVNFGLPILGLERGWVGGTLVVVQDFKIYVIAGDSLY